MRFPRAVPLRYVVAGLMAQGAAAFAASPGTPKTPQTPKTPVCAQLVTEFDTAPRTPAIDVDVVPIAAGAAPGETKLALLPGAATPRTNAKSGRPVRLDMPETLAAHYGTDVTRLSDAPAAVALFVVRGEGGRAITVKTPEFDGDDLVFEGTNAEALAAKEARNYGSETKYVFAMHRKTIPSKAGSVVVLEQEWFPRDPFNPKSGPSRDLGQYLREESATLTAKQKVDLMRELIEGSARLNAIGGVHRDLKPANFLVNDRGVVKVIDFGHMARRIDGEIGVYPALPATPGYASLDSLTGAKPTDAIDGFALGEVLKDVLAPGSRWAEESDHSFAVHVGTRPVDARKFKPFQASGLDSLWSLLAFSTAARSPNAKRTLFRKIEKTLAAEQAGSVDARQKFFLEYGRMLIEMPRRPGRGGVVMRLRAARDILDNPELIARFPSGLGLTAAEADAILVGAVFLRRQADAFLKNPDTREAISLLVATGEINPHAHYTDFFARVDALRKAADPAGYRPPTPETLEREASVEFGPETHPGA